MVLTAVITDIVGASITTAAVSVEVLPNDPPTGSIALAAGAPAAIKPDQSTTLEVHAEDSDGLATIELLAVGPVTEPSQTLTVTGPVADVGFTVTATGDALPGSLTVTARLTDVFGAVAETVPFELSVVANSAPTGSLQFAAGIPAAVLPGESVTVEAHAEDEEGPASVTLLASGPATPPSQLQTVSGTAADVSFSVTVERDALPTDTVTLIAEIRDAFGSPATVTDSLTLGVLADGGAPTVEVAGVAASYAAGEILQAVITTRDEVGASELEITFDGASETIADPGPVYVHQVEVDRTITAPRTTTFEVTATDFAGNTSDPAALTVELVPDLEPAVTTVFVPAPRRRRPGRRHGRRRRRRQRRRRRGLGVLHPRGAASGGVVRRVGPARPSRATAPPCRSTSPPAPR